MGLSLWEPGLLFIDPERLRGVGLGGKGMKARDLILNT